MVAASYRSQTSLQPFPGQSRVLREVHGGIPKGNDPAMTLFFSSLRPKGPGLDEGDSAGMQTSDDRFIRCDWAGEATVGCRHK